jgi:nucleotide-binding universal stress UspA family protein
MTALSSIKTILVPVSGSETDRVVLSTTLSVAQPLGAHLEFLHLCLPLEEAAARAPGVQTLRGERAREALDHLKRQQSNLSTSATHYIQQFCRDHGIDCCTEPVESSVVSATCIEESGPAVATLLFHARHNDLIVLGRAQHVDCMPDDLIDQVLTGSGRPLLIVPAGSSYELLGTIVVGWKETGDAARAVHAAMPLLKLARRVVLVNVAEDNPECPRALEHLSEQLAWHGISAEPRRVGDGVVSAATLLPQVASQLKAGLLVVGGFGHSRVRETVFGGVTRTLIDGASLPVFMVH